MAMNYSNQGQSANNMTTAAPPKANTIGNAIADFDPCLHRAAKCAEHLQSLCDRIIGPRPTPVGTDASGDTSPSALISSIHERRSRLVSILDDMEHSLQTLDGSI